MGKYDKVIGRLARWEGDDPKYQEKVDAVKRAMEAELDFKQSGSYLADAYQDVRIEVDAIEEVLSEANLRKAAIEQLLADQYTNEAVTSVTLEGGGSVRIQKEPHAKVNDKDACRLWAIKEGMERELTLPWQTLNAITKDRLLKGMPEPDGVEAKARTKVVWTKG